MAALAQGLRTTASKFVTALTFLLFLLVLFAISGWSQDLNAGDLRGPCASGPAQSCSSHSRRRLLHIVPMQSGSGNTQSAPPPVTPNLTYYDGPVISNSQIIVVFWGSGVNSTVQSGIAGFYQAILTSNFYQLLGEYDTAGIAFGTNQTIGFGTYAGQYAITPSVCGIGVTCTVTDSQIQSELTAQINAANLPEPTYDSSGNVNTVYMVYFPPNVTIENEGSFSCQEFCAYHGTYNFNDKALAYGVFPDLYTTACNGGCGSSTDPFNNVTAVSSHELAESVTDTDIGLVTGSIGPPAAWYDNNNNDGEIADICNLEEVQVSGYTVQKLWSNSFSACIDAVPSLQLALPGSATAGSAVTLTVTALTSGGSVDPSYLGTVNFSSSDAAAQLPSTYTFAPGDAGVHNFSLTFNTQGSQSVTAINHGYTGQWGTASTVVNSVTHFSVTASANQAAGVPFNVTVTALDSNNSVVTGFSDTVHFTSSDPAAILPADSTLTSGVGVFSVTLKTLGAQTVTAADSSKSTINGSVGVTVGPGPATHFSIVAPSPDTAGTAFNITVSALDAFNNVATGYTGIVKFGSSDGAAVLPSPSTLNNGSGIFSITLNTQGNQSITAADSLNSSIAGSVTVNVLPAGVQITTTQITSTLNPSSYGVPVTFTAQVTAASGTPQGAVLFKAGTLNLGRVTLLAGYASLTTAFLKPGTVTVTATYNGNAHFLTSSNSLSQTETKALTGTDISSSVNPSTAGQTVTFTVTVDSIGGVPAGNVVFSDGSTALGTVPLNNGIAQLSTNKLVSGTHKIRANYNGNPDFVASSATLTQLVH